MSILQTLKVILLIALTSLIAGCKLAVIVVQGGEVQSVGSGTCLAGDICIHEIDADNFSEAFTAVPETGWEFVRWNSGDDFLCGGQTNTVCALTNVGSGAIPAAQAIIDSEMAYYIMPIFTFVGLPVDGIKGADGNEWAQPGTFSGVSRSQLEAACPAGVCSGMLNGYNVDGWNWASGPMVAALFNSYFAGACTYPCITISTTPTDFFGDMVSDGFAVTQSPSVYDYIDGYTSSPAGTSYAGISRLQGADCSVVGCLAQAGADDEDSSSAFAGAPQGAWLYR